MMRLAVFAILVVAGCEVTPPESTDCVEFTRHTFRNGKPVSCQMIWCDAYSPRAHNASGLAALWCDSRD